MSPLRSPHTRSAGRSAFTLIELLVVISILGILMSLGISGAGAIRNQVKNAQARNDCAGLAVAIKNFYTDYYKYPTTSTSDVVLESQTTASGNSAVIKALMGNDLTLNPRSVQYYEPKYAKPASSGSSAGPTGGYSSDGGMFDPWGYTFGIVLDADYNGSLTYTGTVLKYYKSTPGDMDSGTTSWKTIPGGVGVFSLGKNQCKGNTDLGIISWQ